MSEKHSSSTSRRGVLGSIAAAGATSLVGFGSQRVAGVESTDEWNCSTDCPDTVIRDDEFSPGGGYKGGSAIHWFRSVYLDTRNTWEHELSVSVGAASTDQYTYGDVLQGQQYKIQGPDGSILARTSKNTHGEHPGPNSGEIEQWTAAVLKTTLSTLSKTAAPSWFFLVTDKLRNKLGPVDGFDLGVPHGFKHTNTVSIKSWRECTSFHQVQYESDLFSPELNVRTSISDLVTASNVYFWDDITYSLSDYSHPSSLDDPTRLTAREMEELPIRRVPEDERLTTVVDGERHEVTHVATECPFKNVEVSHSRRKERRRAD